jgi:hypothetical protein
MEKEKQMSGTQIFAGSCRDNLVQHRVDSDLYASLGCPHHTQPIFIAGKYLWRYLPVPLISVPLWEQALLNSF